MNGGDAFGMAVLCYYAVALWLHFFDREIGPAVLDRLTKDGIEIGLAKVALVLRPGSVWIGAHWSASLQQLCINLVPFVTIRIRLPRGSQQ